MIPYGRQSIDAADIESVVSVLRSDFLTQGPAVPQFEMAVSKMCGARYAVASNSATSALHLACRALDVRRGDIVWTSPITFVASANCALYCGAEIDFVDVDIETGNISVSALEAKLIWAESHNKLPKVLIVVHFAGQPCDMDSISRLAKKYNVSLVEDASHAIGASYNNEMVGACHYSDITIFSFHPVKIITAGEGGLATTNSSRLAEKMALLRSHGVTRDKNQMVDPSDEQWNYEQIDLGFNYRMTDIHAALGYSQLSKLEEFVDKRNDLAALYDSLLCDSSRVKPLIVRPDRRSAYHLYVIRLLNQSGEKRGSLFDSLRNQGVGVNVHYRPVHTQPYYSNMGFKQNDFPQAEEFYSQILSLPLYPDLEEESVKYIVDRLLENLN